ncbi:MAG: glycosyltransferase family 4 protein [Chloroflexi bacterium]|nr:glycosyltransferase family 4 protein [Chloroflexota bacterium]
MNRLFAFDARTVQDHFPGIARYGFNLVSAMLDLDTGQQFELLGPPPELNTRFDLSPWQSKANARVTTIPASLFSLAGQWRARQWIARVKPRLYHSPYYLMPYWTPCPSIVTVHDLIPLLYPQYFTAMQRLIFGMAMRLAVGRARWIIADSESTARDLRARLHARTDRVVVIHLGVDPVMQPAPAENIEALRAHYGLPEPYVLYVGSNKPHKNLLRLVEAYARIAEREQTPLVVAGHWDAEHPEARERAEQLGLGQSVRWLGAIPADDLPALYSGATLFVFPSEYEGFGLPVLEAMACGAPVLCADSSSLPEVAGVAATLIDPRHIEGWSHAIERLLANAEQRAQMREAGLRRAARFAWSETARQTLAVYRRGVT